jgi:hypothetical protein
MVKNVCAHTRKYPILPKNLFVCMSLLFVFSGEAQQYHNFKVSVYCRAYEVRQMGDTTGYLKPLWNEISRQVKIDKIYLETHRDLVIVDQKTLDIAKKFFSDRGVQVAGGITFTVSEANRFQTFCYASPDDRKKVKEISEYTAKNFNEFILDDFFFTDCKSDESIKEKGDRSWTQYRLALMDEAARNLVVGPAKAVNPKVRVIIKFPNWYEHFQGLGFDLEKEPKIFDGIYTGTETRDAVLSAQHLQPYLGYNVFRYYENILPGGNGGGWVDPGGMNSMDRYAEQLWITLFAKAPEQTLFDFRQLSRPIYPADRAPWQGQGASFDFEEMMQPVDLMGGRPSRPTTIARAAGYTFEKIDRFIGKLGHPVGIRSYRPYHALGEDFLQNYLGMIGLPMDETPQFPSEDSVILLTEEAKYDPAIVQKIKKQLTDGKTVVITSGLLRALQGKGIEDIVELRYSDRKALVKDFNVGFQQAHGEKAILMPQIEYLTNDSWEMVSGVDGADGWPILHEADYSRGKLYILTIPDNFSDLYQFPPEVLNPIRKALGSQLKVCIEGPAQVSLFAYDNNTCIVESFLPQPVTIRVVAPSGTAALTDLETGERVNGEPRRPQLFWGIPKSGPKKVFTVTLPPHSFRAFSFE